MTKYFDRDGNPVPRHLAIDPATGQVRDGITVSVPQSMCDSATIIVRDTPTVANDDAHAGYLARMTRRAEGASPDAVTDAKAPAENAHAAYVARHSRRPQKEA